MVSQRDRVRFGPTPKRILSRPSDPNLLSTPIIMNLPSNQFLQLVQPFPTTISSPKLDLISLAWSHIADRYLQRLESNRIHAGRVRSIRLLAVHDAIHSVIDPGNGYIFNEISNSSSTTAAAAAAIRASHDFLAAIFTGENDREDLADLLDESLSLLGDHLDKAAGVESGARSAAAYLRAFAPLLTPRESSRLTRVPAGHDQSDFWRRSA